MKSNSDSLNKSVDKSFYDSRGFFAVVKLLGERLQRLEMLLERQGSSTRPRTSKQTGEAESGKRKAVVCWTCGKKDHIARFCRSRATEQHQGNFSPSVERAHHVREEDM